MSLLWDDFDGETPDTEDLDTERLLEIRRKTLAAIACNTCTAPNRVWFDQLEAIDEELDQRTPGWRDD